MKFNLSIKCVLVGDSKVGKSSILSRYMYNTFFLNSMSTIGVDFGAKKINIKYGRDDYNIKLNIWDTTGDKLYRSIVESYYMNASYILLVFDINNRISFNSVMRLYDDTKDNNNKTTFILVGNKTDVSGYNQLSEKQISSVAKKENISYLLISAKEDNNIHSLFKHVYIDALKEFDKLTYIEKMSCEKFNNIKVKYDPGVYTYKSNSEVDSCWCGFCKIC